MTAVAKADVGKLSAGEVKIVEKAEKFINKKLNAYRRGSDVCVEINALVRYVGDGDFLRFS